MTHSELVERAVRWLRNTRRCSVVLAEPSGAWEIPDAIGWEGGARSIVVECKASRSDFLRDRKKVFRGAGSDMAVGVHRWYFVAPGVATVVDLPPLWGLVECQESRCKTLRKAKAWKPESGGRASQLQQELMVALSEIRKYQIAASGRRLLPGKAANRIMAELSTAEAPR